MLKQDAGLKGVQSSAGKRLSVLPITPNQWTLLSVVFALFGALAVAVSGNLFLGLSLFAFAALFDVIDGAVARARGEVSKLGGFIDGVADRFVEAFFLFSLMFVPLPTIIIDPRIWIALVIFLGTSMPSFIRAYADHKEAISKEKANALGGICERSERLLLLILGLAGGILFSMDLFVYCLMAVSILSILTIIQRLHTILAQPKV